MKDRNSIVRILLPPALAMTAAFPLSAQNVAPIKLGAEPLYNGFEARKVLFDKAAQKVALDPRIFAVSKEKEGRIVTDPIDLGPADGMIGLPADVKSVDIEVQGDKLDTGLVLEARTGPNKVDESGWSDWRKLASAKATLDTLSGRYIQVKMTLKGTNATDCPAVTQLVLKPQVAPAPASDWKPLKVVDAKIQAIVRSPIPFAYERPDNPKLVKFRREAKLDEVVAGAKDDWERLVKLLDWTSTCKNVRGSKHEYTNGVYAWDIDRVFSIENGTNQIYGHCMSYCEVFVTAASAMGYVSARHYSIRGFKDATHEVPDVWVPSLGKWVYMDPSLSNYYLDKTTKTPLNILELHDIVASTFLPEGKDMFWFADRGNQESRAEVKRIGGKKPVEGRLGPGKYGDPMPADYDWGWSHGYLACGFIQMTPRNDFHSHPEKASRRFSSYPGYDGFPNWVDEKTPPHKGAHNWYTRKRDFYWTLDQATLNLVRSADGKSLQVQLGQSMPFFKQYRIKVDGSAVADVSNPYHWTLRSGENTLEVAPIDEFGKVGLASTVTLELGK